MRRRGARLSCRQPDRGIEQAMQRLGAFWQLREVAFLQGLSESVEQAPNVPPFKSVMPWLAPLMQHGWNETIGTNTYIRGADDEVMGFNVGDIGFFVGGDAFVLIMPFGEQESDGAADQLRQVAHDEPGVFSGEFDLAGERQVVTNEDRGTSDNTSRKGLVVAVTETQNPAIIVVGFLGVDFHETEISLALMGQRMSLRTDAQVGAGQRALHSADEFRMRDGAPALRMARRGDGADFVELDMRGTAMQHEVRAAALDELRLGIEIGNHSDVFLSGMKRGRTRGMRIRPRVDMGRIRSSGLGWT